MKTKVQQSHPENPGGSDGIGEALGTEGGWEEMMGGRCEKNVGSAREDRNYMIELYVLYIYIYIYHTHV